MADNMRMPSIAFIVARSHPGKIIGCENRLPWRLRTDMEFFKQVTSGHAIIMGRKTFDSIGRPLPGRLNIVLSRHPGNDADNLRWVSDRESALFAADLYSILQEKVQFFVVGGGEVYKIFADLFNKIFLTEVYADIPRGDAFFELDFDMRQWTLLESQKYQKSERDEFDFQISVLERKIKTIRQRELSEFLVADPSIETWVNAASLSYKARRFAVLPEEQFTLPMIAA